MLGINYLNDGANAQAQAVLMLLQMGDGIEASWNGNEYTARVNVARWENCREQGYVLSLKNNDKQLNIAFFEHRNSDNICAIKWFQNTLNSPTINSANFGDQVYVEGKYDVSASVGYGEIYRIANWISQQFVEFYES